MTNLRVYYHPFSRAATAIWMLEEIGEPYDVKLVDITKGEQKEEDILSLNRMGKIPIIKDGEAVVSETSAIGMYLADRYSAGTLAPALDDPKRGPYLRWCVFGASVVEPSCMAHGMDWKYSAVSAGFGEHDAMLRTLEEGLKEGPWLLGERFTMADVILGSTLMFMMRFNMLEPQASFQEYTGRLAERPAAATAQKYNDEMRAKHAPKS